MKTKWLAAVGFCTMAGLLAPVAADADSQCWRVAQFKCVDPDPNVRYLIGYDLAVWEGGHDNLDIGYHNATVCGGVQYITLGFHCKKAGCDKEVIMSYWIYKYRESDLEGDGTTWKKVKKYYKKKNLQPDHGDAIRFAPNSGTPTPAVTDIPQQ